MKIPTIVIGCDHGGFKMKEAIKNHFKGQFLFIDVGCYDEKSVDYPVFAFEVAKRVANDSHLTGILVCSSGFGMCIAANKVKGIRAICITEPKLAELAKTHNDANVITLSGKYVSEKDNFAIINNFMNAKFDYNNPDNVRHVKRIGMIMNYERNEK